ncbi:MAG: aminotransferase class I/II-fold pyridoxal phosphate-dependent enzyme [Verrucomicrobiota bacterium]
MSDLTTTAPTPAPSRPRSRIADQVAAIPRSGIRDFFELVQGRPDVISLGVGEPDYAAPWHIREAAIFSLEKGQTSYTSNLGMPRLRDAIAGYVEEKFDVSYSGGTEVIVTVGVSEALDLACRALLNPGDEVLYHEPCYVSYSPSVALAYGVPISVPTVPEEGFPVKADEVAKRITPRSRILMLNFPTNPTGGVQPLAELKKLAALAIEHDLIVITDEIYSELRYHEEAHVSIASLPGMRERTILLHGFSKAFAMTGFRLGYACAPQDLIEAMMKIHQYAMLCAPITSQAAALEALENGAGPVEAMRQDYGRRRDLIVKGLNQAGLPCFEPGGAFYAFPDIRPTGLSSHEFATRLVQEESVAAVPGSAFGETGEGFLRCCYATDPKLLEKALLGIRRFVDRLG